MPQRERLALHCLGLGGYQTYVPRKTPASPRHNAFVNAAPSI